MEPAASTTLLNQHLDGYRVVQLLGRGGMGAVYRAIDTTLERDVAVKILHPSLAGDEQVITRFRNEARALARFNHPCIVQVYGVGTSPQGTYIAMEYVEGRTLGDTIQEGKPLPWQEAAALLCSLLGALETAHRSGVVHRDIKPKNIMLTPEPSVKLMDFGLAMLRQHDRAVTATRTIAGTLYYMSPEQVRSLRDVDHRTDLYSLGMTIYQVLCGRLPFDTDQGDFDILRAIVEEPWPELQTFAPAVPDALASIIMQAIAKQPGERFASAREMLDVLADLDLCVPISSAVPLPAAAPAQATRDAAAAPSTARTNGIVTRLGGMARDGLAHLRDQFAHDGSLPPPPPAPPAASPRAAEHGATMLLDATAPTAFFDATFFHEQSFSAENTVQFAQRYQQIEQTIHFYRDNLSEEYAALQFQARTTYVLWVICVTLGFIMLLVGMGFMLMGHVTEGIVTVVSTTLIHFIQRVFQQREDHYRRLADAKRSFLEYGNHWLLVLHSISGISDPTVREQRQSRLVEVMMAKMQSVRREPTTDDRPH